MTRQDAYKKIAEAITEQLEQGVMPWRKPWSVIGTPMSMSTGKPYRGMNQILLAMTMTTAGYESPWWGTYKQIKQQGGQVRKGEKSSLAILWKQVKKKDAVDDDDTYWMLRAFSIFNAAQADGLPDKFFPKPGDKVETIVEADAIVDGWYDGPGPALEFGGDRAYYTPGIDLVTVPERHQFTSTDGYYSTLFHEASHSTGHAARLNREGITGGHRFGSVEYAEEELVAEFSAAFLCAEAGVDSGEPDEAHAAYIESWVKLLHEDPKAVTRAVSAARKAADLIQAAVADGQAAAA